jgi:hypothetical protein
MTFSPSSGAIIKARENSLINYSQNALASAPSKLFSLRDSSVIESVDSDLAGGIKAAGNSRIALIRGSFVGASIISRDSASLEAEGTAFGAHTDAIISALGASQVAIWSSSFGGSQGLLLRTVGRIIVSGVAIADCTVGIDLGGAANCVIQASSFARLSSYALYAHSSQFVVDQCQFDDCGVRAVDVTNSHVTFSNCAIVGNTGGAFAAHEGSLVGFTGSSVLRSGAFGVVCDLGATFSADVSEFSENQGPAIVANGKVQICNSRLTKNATLAAQVRGEASLLWLHACDVMENGTGVIAFDRGRLKLSDSAFVENGLHLEVRENAKLLASATRFEKSVEGIGIVILEKGIAHLEACSILGESRYGLISFADATISQTEITGCGVAGLAFSKDAKGRVANCRIEGNTGAGVHIIDGCPVFVDCTISGNGKQGIVESSESFADVEGAQVSGNTGGDIVTGTFKTA